MRCLSASPEDTINAVFLMRSHPHHHIDSTTFWSYSLRIRTFCVVRIHINCTNTGHCIESAVKNRWFALQKMVQTESKTSLNTAQTDFFHSFGSSANEKNTLLQLIITSKAMKKEGFDSAALCLFIYQSQFFSFLRAADIYQIKSPLTSAHLWGPVESDTYVKMSKSGMFPLKRWFSFFQYVCVRYRWVVSVLPAVVSVGKTLIS